MIRLLLTLGDERRELQFETAEVSIGRGSANAVPISDRRLSRRHARIERDDLGFLLTDLGSANGTWLNRRRVSAERLVQGDEIRLGPAILHVLTLSVSAQDRPEARGHRAVFSRVCGRFPRFFKSSDFPGATGGGTIEVIPWSGSGSAWRSSSRAGNRSSG